MTDGIIKGTGNSRYLKGPANAAALYPDFEAFRDAWAAGTLPFDFNGINPAGWEVVGDKLGKATLLTDALCTALSLPTTATPTQAMEKLRQLVATAQSGVDNGVKLQNGSYYGSGSTTKSISFSFNPKFLVIENTAGISPLGYAFANGLIWVTGQANAAIYGESREETVSIQPSANNITLIAPYSSGAACNSSGTHYYYIAIG